MVGGFDVILADKGFLIRVEISADIVILSTGGQTHEVFGGFIGRVPWLVLLRLSTRKLVCSARLTLVTLLVGKVFNINN